MADQQQDDAKRADAVWMAFLAQGGMQGIADELIVAAKNGASAEDIRPGLEDFGRRAFDTGARLAASMMLETIQAREQARAPRRPDPKGFLDRLKPRKRRRG